MEDIPLTTPHVGWRNIIILKKSESNDMKLCRRRRLTLNNHKHNENTLNLSLFVFRPNNYSVNKANHS